MSLAGHHVEERRNTSRHQGNVDDVASVFGWNPFGKDVNHGPLSNQEAAPLANWAASNFEIAQLADLYQQQLVELTSDHHLILEDQKLLSVKLLPFLAEDGTAIAPPDDDTLLLKRGLDLRLVEYEDECRRVQQTERRLQRKIDDCTLDYETQVVEAQGYVEERLLCTIREQQKLLSLQQAELDELRFQRDLYSDETRRLRQLCRFGDWVDDGFGAGHQSPPQSPRTLHEAYSGSTPRFEWMQEIKHSKRKTDKKYLRKLADK